MKKGQPGDQKGKCRGQRGSSDGCDWGSESKLFPHVPSLPAEGRTSWRGRMPGLLGHKLGLVEGAGVLQGWYAQSWPGMLGIPGHGEIHDP